MKRNILKIQDSLKKRSSNFDVFTEYIQRKDVIDQTHEITRNIHPRYYLSAHTLYYFPDICMNKNIDKILFDLSKQVSIETDITLLNTLLTLFKQRFEEWKKGDKKVLCDSIFMQYHNSGVDLLNAEDDDDKNIIKEIRDGLLETARKVGGDELCDEITSVRPVVLDIREVEKQFSNAFWDKLKEEYDTQQYTLLIDVIKYVKDIFKAISPGRVDYIDDIMDVEYIQRVMKSEGRDEYMGVFVMTILDFIKEHQAPIRDIRLKGVREMVGVEERRIDIIKGIVNLAEQIVIDINNNKMYNK